MQDLGRAMKGQQEEAHKMTGTDRDVQKTLS